MLEYTALFANLEELFDAAGGGPEGYRKLLREVANARDELKTYYDTVTHDFVERLKRRLVQPEVQLGEEEVTLLRAYLGLPPADAEREERLLADLAGLQESMDELRRLRAGRLSMDGLQQLRRVLDRMSATLPPIVVGLEVRERVRAFEQAVGDGAEGLDRAALLAILAEGEADEG
ncbi:MAG: hypothetical protein R3F62_01315 [Planctomycetota bacterium]